MYVFGEGVAQDYQTAIHWYQLAANQGDAAARLNLGLLYSDGLGIPQDYEAATRWVRLAADQGLSAAQYQLGIWYTVGSVISRDYTAAHMWLNLAAAQGLPDAREKRDELSRRMSRAQIVAAQQAAREWKPTDQ